MSMKVEVEAVDAELLSYLKKAKASRVMNWDMNINEGVVLKIDLTYGLDETVPAEAIEAINKAIAVCVEAFKPKAT